MHNGFELWIKDNKNLFPSLVTHLLSILSFSHWTRTANRRLTCEEKTHTTKTWVSIRWSVSSIQWHTAVTQMFSSPSSVKCSSIRYAFKDECMKLTASCLVNAACERIMTGSKFETGVHYWANSTIAEPHKNPIFMSVCARVLLSNRGCHCFHVWQLAAPSLALNSAALCNAAVC